MADFDSSNPRRDGQTPPDLGQLFDRLPPHSPDAERSLLGSILLDPQVLTEVVPIVASEEMFYREAHGAIFKALLDTYEAHQSGDVVQLVELLRGRGILDRVGGQRYIMELAEAVPSAASAPHYARVVADSARLRRLIDAAGTILYEAYNEGMARPDAARTIIDSAEQKVFEIAQEEDAIDQETLAELLQQVYEQIELAKDEQRPITGVPSGFVDLDDKLSGLQPGEMLIMAARPSMGKTALGLNMAEQIAFGGRTPWAPKTSDETIAVGLFSLEMSRKSLVQRLISARSGIDAHKMRTGQVSEDDLATLMTACDDLRNAPIHIDDTPGMTVLQLRAKARRMVQRHGVKVIIIDYLQLLTSPTQARESRQVEVSTISRGIKALARELKIPVVCLAQLNRGATQREGNRPRMSDLRESGSIEQDADVVMLLHREAYYHKGEATWDPKSAEFDEDNREKLNLTELIIAKQRNGPTGVIRLTWDERTTRFKNHEGDHHPGGSWGYSAGGAVEPKRDAPGLPEPGSKRYSFEPGRQTGPIEGHRDGGGPERFGGMGGGGDDTELPPF